jgi:diguanylate cyclase (GGDEF)-like protein
LFANNKIKNNGFWEKNKPMKCYKALYGFDNFCDKYNHKCDNIEAINMGHNVTCSRNILDKNGNKSYLAIKTIPLKYKNNNIYALLKAIQDRTNDRKRELTLQHTINHDILTGIPNRILLNDRLNQAMLRSKRDDTCFTVMFLDFDGFKKINDKYGHKIGDIILIQATCRMQKSLRKIDTIARIGGDEFIIVLEGISNKNQIESIAKDILNKLRSIFIINKKIKIKMTCSIGIDIYNPKQTKKSKEKLLQNADNSMYEVKKSGKDGFKFNLETYIDE